MVGLPADRLIRHRGSMLMLDTLLEIDWQRAVCEWRVSSDCALLVPGRGVPAYAAIECMAQCVAVHAGAMARSKGLAPPLGLLLGTRNFHADISWLQVGARYRVECQQLMRDEQGMAAFDCQIQHRDKIIAVSRLAVFEKESGKLMYE